MPQHNHLLMADAVSTNTTALATGSSVLGIGKGAITPSGSFNVDIYSSATPGTTLAPQVVANNGGSVAHLNMQPYLTLNFCIALQGIFPSQN